MEFLFWLSLVLVIYCYLGYPLLALLAARLCPRPLRQEDILPTVSVVIAVWNEEDVIADKLRNLIELDYPAGKVEILIGSDHSTDRTDEIVRGFGDQRVRLFEFAQRRGKPSVLNALVPQAGGEVIFFNDARQMLAKDALRLLVKNFADPQVGCASGELVFLPPQTSTGKGVDFYWRYEKFIRSQESRIHSMLGATGAIYAIRKELFTPLPADVILDDMYLPFRVIERGYRVIFDDQPRAYDRVAESAKEEHRRKIRTIAGNYQIFAMLPQMFLPGRSPIAWQLFSHKFLRVVAPFFLMLIFVLNMFLLDNAFYLSTGITQILFYSAAVAGAGLRHRKDPGLQTLCRLCYIPYVFCLLNFSALAGFWNFVTSRPEVKWGKAREI